MPKPRTMLVGLGPAVPAHPVTDFTAERLPKAMLEDAWRIVGPTVERNMNKHHPLQLWQIIAAAYLEGLEHGSEMERERRKRPDAFRPPN